MTLITAVATEPDNRKLAVRRDASTLWTEPSTGTLLIRVKGHRVDHVLACPRCLRDADVHLLCVTSPPFCCSGGRSDGMRFTTFHDLRVDRIDRA